MENEKELILERVFDAPIEKVWRAWTDAEILKKWWGPDNVTIPECEVDLRVGGKFYIVMKAGEGMGPLSGMLWPMLAHFTAVEPNAKLSYDGIAWTEGQKENTTIDQTTEMLFSEENGKTKLKLTATVHKTAPGAKMAIQGMEMGFTQQLGKLTAFLAEK